MVIAKVLGKTFTSRHFARESVALGDHGGNANDGGRAMRVGTGEIKCGTNVRGKCESPRW